MRTLSVPFTRPTLGTRPFPILCLLLVLVATVALTTGFRPVAPSEIWHVITAYDAQSAHHIVLRDIRLPRMLAALIVGAALGSAGALMQAMTRNPLADPGLLGVNAGAALGVVLSTVVLGMTHPGQFIWSALSGALLAAALVFALGGIGGTGRMDGSSSSQTSRLILAGVAVSALFLALTRGLLLLSRKSLEVYRFWVLGGFDGIDFSTLTALLPFFFAGLVLAALATVLLNALMLGEDTARALGVQVGGARLLTCLAIVTLCGASVALAGPIAFVGLIVPHIARATAGQHMPRQARHSAFIGAILMISADLLGRLAVFGGNMQAGVMAALIGGPILVIYVRRRKGAGL